MARIPLKLEEMIDSAELRRTLDALAGRADAIPTEARAKALCLFKDALAAGRRTAETLLLEDGGGTACAMRLSHLMDEIICALHDFALTQVPPPKSAVPAPRMAVVATGGYGRGTLAPGSDIDLLFLLPAKQTPWGEAVVEYMLYMLWDMGLKVGHATRNIDECVRLSRSDITIRTSILEARFLWAEEALFDQLMMRFDKEVVKGTGAEYVQAKLAERDERHAKAGDTRYLVEPNVKDGKGGLRDLHTLFWIGKYFYRVRSGEELVDKGVFTRAEYDQFRKAEDFLWAVRCHMHFLTGKAEERLHFDIQREIAKRLGYTSHPGLSAVERFMKHYFLIAKDVGDLTRIFCAALEEEQAKHVPGFNRIFLTFPRRKRKLAGTCDFIVDNHRINIADDKVFQRDPVNMLRLFWFADKHGLEYHPDALKLLDPLARPGRQDAAPRPRGEPAVPRRADFGPQSGTQSEAHERGRVARQADPRFRQDRRDDAVLDVSPLYGRRASHPLHRRALRDRARRRREDPSAVAFADAGAEEEPRGALRRRAAARHRQGPAGGPLGGRRQDRAPHLPAYGPVGGGHGDRCLAGREPSPDVDDGADARPERPQDDRRFCFGRAVGRTAEAFARAHRLRYPRRRTRRLERLEGPAPAHALLRDRAAPDRRLLGSGSRRPRDRGARAACGRRLPTGRRRRARRYVRCTTRTICSPSI